MDKKYLNQRTEELVEAINNLNSSRHNPSAELEAYTRLLFDQLMYEITSGY